MGESRSFNDVLGEDDPNYFLDSRNSINSMLGMGYQLFGKIRPVKWQQCVPKSVTLMHR